MHNSNTSNTLQLQMDIQLMGLNYSWSKVKEKKVKYIAWTSDLLSPNYLTTVFAHLNIVGEQSTTHVNGGLRSWGLWYVLKLQHEEVTAEANRVFKDWPTSH